MPRARGGDGEIAFEIEYRGGMNSSGPGEISLVFLQKMRQRD